MRPRIAIVTELRRVERRLALKGLDVAVMLSLKAVQQALAWALKENAQAPSRCYAPIAGKKVARGGAAAGGR